MVLSSNQHLCLVWGISYKNLPFYKLVLYVLGRLLWSLLVCCCFLFSGVVEAWGTRCLLSCCWVQSLCLSFGVAGSPAGVCPCLLCI